MAVTTEQIHAAADALVAAGQKPTYQAIKDSVGGCSYSVISQALKTWTRKTPAALTPGEEAPEAVAAAATSLAATVWAAAQQTATAKLAAERAALDEARSELESRAQESAELADSLTTQLETARAALDTTQQELRQAQEQAAERGTELTRATATLEECQKRLAELTETLAHERSTVKSLLERPSHAQPAKGPRS